MFSLLKRLRDWLMRRTPTAHLLLIGGTALIGIATAATIARAGNAINAETTGAAGTAIVVSNTTPTQLLKANPNRYGWTIYCIGASGSTAVMVEPGDALGNAAGSVPNTIPPSQTVGFPIPANGLITDEDFPLRGLEALHQRLDAVASGSSAVNCYTWEEQ
jgi:hypothetical protein